MARAIGVLWQHTMGGGPCGQPCLSNDQKRGHLGTHGSSPPSSALSSTLSRPNAEGPTTTSLETPLSETADGGSAWKPVEHGRSFAGGQIANRCRTKTSCRWRVRIKALGRPGRSPSPLRSADASELSPPGPKLCQRFRERGNRSPPDGRTARLGGRVRSTGRRDGGWTRRFERDRGGARHRMQAFVILGMMGR